MMMMIMAISRRKKEVHGCPWVMMNLKDDQVGDRSWSSTIYSPTPSVPEIRLVNHAWDKTASAWRMEGVQPRQVLNSAEATSCRVTAGCGHRQLGCLLFGEENQRTTHWVTLVELVHIQPLLLLGGRGLPHHRGHTCPSSEVQSEDCVSPFPQFLVLTFILKIVRIDDWILRISCFLSL